MDPRVQKMADVLVSYSLGVKPGEWVVIKTTQHGEPLALACAHAVLRADANPSFLLESELFQELLLTEANDAQLAFASPLSASLYEQVDAQLTILAPGNTRSLAAVDPTRITRRRRGSEAVAATYQRRSADGTLRWAITQFPTDAAAQDAGMSLRDYEDFVFDAAFVTREDPIAAWQRLSQRQQRLIDWIEPKGMIRVQGPGTDLSVSTSGRRWINSDGRRNFPSGEIFTGPIEQSVEGSITFSFPASLGGQQVQGVRLRFEAGKVVDATAAKNESFLLEMLALDDGARYVGEFAFGTNEGIQRFTQNTLFDEKIGGTMHIALGQSYPETGGVNHSTLHWDMVYDLRDGGVVTVDSIPFSRNGQFLV